MDMVCVVGAGSSGIASCQVLHARGIPFDCFEVGSEVGGNWRYLNDNGMSSAYRSLHINSSKESMQYAAYPMPREWPSYLGHKAIASYFDDYVEHFGFRDRIQFRTRVVDARPAEGSGWLVTVRHEDTGEERTRRYRAVLVANGHHWDPRYPDPPFPGTETFSGEQLHSHDYKTPERFAGKRVLVVGFGNSACDIAVESSMVAERTVMSIRRTAHVLPKFLFGIPTDHLTLLWASTFPNWVQRKVFRVLLLIARGRMSSYGIPEPDHEVLRSHPTISDSLLSKVGHGDITVRPNIERIDGEKVFFVDGTAEVVDTIVWGTGYKISFPFLDPELVPIRDNEVTMYRRVVPIEHPGLYFIGLVQPVGAIMPCAEAQSEWVADLLEGKVALPAEAKMRREIAARQAVQTRRYVASQRHTIQVDFARYLSELRRERRRQAVRRAPARTPVVDTAVADTTVVGR
ncbi:MAG TPA: NAD(P)-binding domain-containing protein [Micromonosporaceae bacterium]|nr:NAD(P)-binding domain-containing protein [Micromonosporaceae bacterium]